MYSVKNSNVFTCGLTLKPTINRSYHWWHRWVFNAILIYNSDGFQKVNAPLQQHNICSSEQQPHLQEKKVSM